MGCENMKKTFIIAEAGCNHNGSIELAYRLIDEAVAAGVDCVKFQTFKAESLVAADAQMAEYQKKNIGKSETQFAMLKKLELSYADFTKLKAYCEGKNILFLSTPFDLESIDFLDELGMPFWKVPSGEITNYPYLKKLAATGKPVVMSTGMSDMTEIRQAIEVLQKYGAGEIKLLHCNTEYPTPMQDVNLLAMLAMHKEFNCPVGYSDHTKGIEVPIAAVALGAEVIEKHFTLDRNMEGPDHKASLVPQELQAMVAAIRNIEQAVGRPEKFVTDSEGKNREIARKSIVAKRPLAVGDIFTEENLTVKRPGNGLSPMLWEEVLGKKAPHAFARDEMIEL